MPTSPVIAIVEDDDSLRLDIERYLRDRGWQVWSAGSAEDLYKQMTVRSADLMVVDVVLSGEDGLNLIAHLASIGRFGLIAMTAPGATNDRINALKAGADLHVEKQGEFGEIEAGIGAVLRRMRQPLLQRGDDQPVPWALDTLGKTLRSPTGEVIELTVREVDLMTYLMARPGEVVDKYDLLFHVTGSAALDDFHRIESMLYRVRKKVEQAFGRGLPVRSVFGRGLTFVGCAHVKSH